MNNALKITLMSAALAVFALPGLAQDSTAPANPPHNTVNQREQDQQNRIGNGVKDGQLTPGQAAHLERNQARIDRQVRNERAANGGKLTPQERAQVNREQNRQSRKIYRDKHDGK
ncbi:MAG TPA: hypothetical protein VMX38_18160 [Verrucomicrobiae bacterium]|nr:hypothetical protein [Verrucomicrobiae bacterium]